MSNNIDQSLSRAYDLIEENKHDEARNILEPILADDANNADVWWVYAHAVEDRALAQDALNNVLRVDPNYSGAQELLEKSEAINVPITSSDSTDDTDDFDVFGDDFEEDDNDDFDTFDDDFDDDLEEDEDEQNPRKTIFRLLAVVALILVLLFVFLILNPFGEGDDDPDVTATQNVQVIVPVTDEPDAPTLEPVSTLIPTEMPTVDETEEVSDIDMQTVSDDFLDELYDQLGTNLQVVEDSAEFRQTSLGNTLLVSVCSGLGDVFRTDLTEAMNSYAEANDTITDDSLDAVGISMLDCDANNNVLNEIATSRANLTDFAQGDIQFEEYRSNWQIIGE